MQEEDSFSAGDLVAVFGGYISKEDKAADTVTICKVIISGLHDLLVQNTAEFVYSRQLYLVPKKTCKKLVLDSSILFDVQTLKPKIGDLVLSYSKNNIKKEDPEQTTGIIYKILYKMSTPFKCTLICGSEMKDVLYSNLIVLDRN
ncbi:hypothetical protein CL634_00110 [bacterium]|nr:hypothetical protein [bacterium]